MLAAGRGSFTKFGGVPCRCHFGGLRIGFFGFCCLPTHFVLSSHVIWGGGKKIYPFFLLNTDLIGYEPKNMDDVVLILLFLVKKIWKKSGGWARPFYSCKTTIPVASRIIAVAKQKLVWRCMGRALNLMDPFGRPSVSSATSNLWHSVLQLSFSPFRG